MDLEEETVARVVRLAMAVTAVPEAAKVVLVAGILDGALRLHRQRENCAPWYCRIHSTHALKSMEIKGSMCVRASGRGARERKVCQSAAHQH